MASNAKSTNVAKLSQFSTIPPYEQQAVMLHNEGLEWKELSAKMAELFPQRKPLATETIRHWFIPGGRLEQANMEYLEALASESLKEAKQLARRASKTAIATMTILMGTKYDPQVRLGAAKAMANKYIPDRQVIYEGPSEDEELPEELANTAEKLLDGEEHNGPEQVDEPPKSETVGEGPGTTGGEEIPPTVLQEPDSPDKPSDPAA